MALRIYSVDVMPVPTLSSTLVYADGLFPLETFVQRRKGSLRVFKPTSTCLATPALLGHPSGIDPTYEFPQSSGPKNKTKVARHSVLRRASPLVPRQGSSRRNNSTPAQDSDRPATCRRSTWEACQILRISSIPSVQTSPPMSRHTSPIHS
jgi:hypothetical protein